MAKSGPPDSTPAWWVAAAVFQLCLLWAELPQPILGNSTASTKATTTTKATKKTTVATTVPGVHCGKAPGTGRILHGQDAPEGKWPWQASVVYRNRHVCGGSLIDNFWVVTAATCVQKSNNPEDYKILLGYSQLEKPASYSQIMRVHNITVHKSFNKQYYMENNIAMLQVHQRVHFSPYIFPICITTTKITIDYKSSCWITGWGMLTENRHLDSPYQLQEAKINVLERWVCEIHIQPPTKHLQVKHDGTICGGGFENGKNICQGDTGGPLVCKVNGVWYLVGISSWGFDCKDPTSPSVFTNVKDYRNWISTTKFNVTEPLDAGESMGLAPSLSNYTINSQNCLALKSKTKTIILLLVFPLESFLVNAWPY